MTCEKYRNCSKEEKGTKWEYECKQYKNLPEDQKQRLAELEKFAWEALEKKNVEKHFKLIETYNFFITFVWSINRY